MDHPAEVKTVLHVGCGVVAPGKLHATFQTPDWREIRLDVNPEANPDIVASITDMTAVASDSVDAVWSSHNLEHLYAHEVPTALAEFWRVLNEGGFLLTTLPDLQAVAAHVAGGNLEGPLYVSRAGPVSAIDILYGFRPAIAQGNHHMAHKTGFTEASLAGKLRAAGFRNVQVRRQGFDLWATGYK